MKTWLIAATLVLAATMAAAQAPKPAASAEAPAGNADTGKKLWTSYGCWQCHGYEAQGGAAGAQLAGRTIPWAVFSAYVRRPANQMPPYAEKVLPNSDLAHLYAYLRSRPAPPAAQSLPLLQK